MRFIAIMKGAGEAAVEHYRTMAGEDGTWQEKFEACGVFDPARATLTESLDVAFRYWSAVIHGFNGRLREGEHPRALVRIQLDPRQECPACEGSGVSGAGFERDEDEGFEPEEDEDTCGTCSGSGGVALAIEGGVENLWIDADGRINRS